jgi:chromate reductase, NAD(P)H dehydrogenase (quinone)
VDATKLRANIDERLRNQSPKFLSWAQESRDRLDSAQAEAGRRASRTEFAGWAIAGALAMYLALTLRLPGRGAGLDAEIIGGLTVALIGRLAWRLRLFARGQRKISDARKHWEKVLEEAIALSLIAQEINLLLGDDVTLAMDMAIATLTGNGRDPEVPVISAAMKNVAATARTIGSGSIGMPKLQLFNPDDDKEPLHPAVTALRAAITQADALLISTPEYAGDLPGAFKNLLDWTVGGVEIGEKPTAWINVSNSGPQGAYHTYESLRRVLGFTGAAVIDDACARIPVRRDCLGPDGLVVDPEVSGQLASAFNKFIMLASALIVDRSSTQGKY